MKTKTKAVKIRKSDFLIFNRQINGNALVYLDSAATSLMPKQVIEAVSKFTSEHRANVHRGVHSLSQEAGEYYEEARGKVARFIGAPDVREIIFTRNATESINLVAYTWGEKNLKKGDAILVTIAEHHANFVPWQQFAKKKGAKLLVADVDKNGILDLADFRAKVKGAKLVAVGHASNVTGVINPVRTITELAHDAGALVLIDGAQAVPHLAIDVKSLGADFYAFSSHKMLGPSGVGVLWGRSEILDSLEPFNYGGDMIKEVSIDNSVWNDLPYKFEAGTPNIEGAIGLGAAVDYLNGIGMDKVRQHEVQLLEYAFSKLGPTGIDFVGPADPKLKTGVISFTTPGAHPHDVAEVLNGLGIAIRTGHHCAMPLHTRLGLDATSRASFYIYNDKSDVDSLAAGLKQVREIFR